MITINNINEMVYNVVKTLLFENKESRNRHIARNYTRSLGYDDSLANKIDMMILHDIPNVRLSDCKFMLGLTRILLSDEMTKLKNDTTSYTNAIINLNKYLRIISSQAHINEYDNNLNNLNYSEIDRRFSGISKQQLQQDIERSNNMNIVENTAYQIVRIPSFYDASEYSQYVEWCITQYEENYKDYTHNNTGIFYFCLKDGFENTPQITGENTPLDEYGLSMIAVSVNSDGSPNTITCRWNHENGGSDQVMSVEDLEKIIGRKFYQTFKPRTQEELNDIKRYQTMEIYETWDISSLCSNLTIDKLLNDKTLEPLFDINDFIENLNDENWFRNEKIYQQPYKTTAYDYGVDDIVSLIINGDGDLLFDEWVYDAKYLYNPNLIVLQLNKKPQEFNILNLTTQSLTLQNNVKSVNNCSYYVNTINLSDNTMAFIDKDGHIINNTYYKNISEAYIVPNNRTSGFNVWFVVEKENGLFNIILFENDRFQQTLLQQDVLKIEIVNHSIVKIHEKNGDMRVYHTSQLFI